ncbi:uncharacterized protein LOC113359238 [Papaver somniferum]|uniref:uncharacterized protein LOC113359238 n=1 Tax=Papaver somniferum TaxID=3469 RepID=UPI000E6F624D|nr:uncharacterized protein LOC113359238 [Papaver somniferum]
MRECNWRCKGKVTVHEKNEFDPSQKELYSPGTFLENYWCHQASDAFEGFGVGISRSRKPPKGPRLITDLDPSTPSNIMLRKAHDPKWFLVPLRIVGPYIFGLDELGNVLPGIPDMHSHLRAYKPWELKWVPPRSRPSPSPRVTEDAKRRRVADGSGPSNTLAVVAEHAMEVDIGALFGDNEVSNLADKGVSSDTSARFGGGVNVSGALPLVSSVGAPGVPSTFAGGFPPVPTVPSSSYSTAYLFSGGS